MLEEKEKILFTEMCEICLWGNATDLSLLTTLTYEDIQKLQGAEARKSAEANILVNDLPAAYRALKAAQKEGKKERRIDIVLDNAGFELFVDLVLAGYLLESGLATQIFLHPKSMPWFVSDVIPADIQTLLSGLALPSDLFQTDKDGQAPQPGLSEEEADKLQTLFEHWSNLYAKGQLIIRPNAFWTTEHSFWSLPSKAPQLWEDFKESELVIFKGDLNYRKLTADVRIPNYSFPQISETKLTIPLGNVANHNPLSHRNRPPRHHLRHPHPRPPHMQSRHRGRSQRRRRREIAARNRGRNRTEEMGMERQIRRRAIL